MANRPIVNAEPPASKSPYANTVRMDGMSVKRGRRQHVPMMPPKLAQHTHSNTGDMDSSHTVTKSPPGTAAVSPAVALATAPGLGAPPPSRCCVVSTF